MGQENIDFDNVSEDELAAMRGDNFGEEETPPTAEVELPPATEEEPPASAESEAVETGEEESQPSSEADSAAEAVDTSAEEAPPAVSEEETAPTFMIPKSRYDAVMARLKEAEANQQQAPAPAAAPVAEQVPNRLAEIDKEIAEAVKDGDGDKTALLFAEARQIQQDTFHQELQTTSTQTSAQAIAQVKYDTLVQQVERFVPETNPDSDNYDEGMVLEVQDLMEAFTAKGHESSDALIRALNYVKPGWDTPNAPAAPQAQAPAPEPAPEPETKKTDVKRNLADAKTTPPSMDEGTNSDTAGRAGKLDVMKISDAEFEKLTERQLAELRGDDA